MNPEQPRRRRYPRRWWAHQMDSLSPPLVGGSMASCASAAILIGMVGLTFQGVHPGLLALGCLVAFGLSLSSAIKGMTVMARWVAMRGTVGRFVDAWGLPAGYRGPQDLSTCLALMAAELQQIEDQEMAYRAGLRARLGVFDLEREVLEAAVTQAGLRRDLAKTNQELRELAVDELALAHRIERQLALGRELERSAR